MNNELKMKLRIQNPLFVKIHTRYKDTYSRIKKFEEVQFLFFKDEYKLNVLNRAPSWSIGHDSYKNRESKLLENSFLYK